MLPRGEVRARCRSGIRHRIDIASFGGDIKLFLCVAYWMYLTHIQLGFLGLRRIDKGSSELYCFSLVVPCCCCYWSTDDRNLYRTKSFCEKDCVWQLTQFLLPGKELGLNRISNPDWVKLCVDLSYAPNQNTKFPSDTHLILLDQGFPVEYELDEFNPPHTGTTLSRLQLWLCRLRRKISLRQPATSSLGNIFWRHSHLSPQTTRTTNSWATTSFLFLTSKHDLCYTYGDHTSLTHSTMP